MPVTAEDNVSWRVEVGAALVSEVLNINELRQHSVPSPLKIVGSARLRFRTTSVSMRYRYSPRRALTGWRSIIQLPRISRIIRNKTTFRVRLAAAPVGISSDIRVWFGGGNCAAPERTGTDRHRQPTIIYVKIS